MYKKILVTLDGSKFAEAVLPFVEEIARMQETSVQLIHVVPPPEDRPFDTAMERADPDYSPRLDQMVSRMAKHRQAYLDQVAGGLRAKGVAAQGEVLYGRPASEITQYASHNDVDLVAMTTHGRSGLARWRYGSVAGEVLQSITVPLFLFRSSPETSEAASSTHDSALSRIIVPLDGSELAEQALPHARALALSLGLDIDLIRIVSPPTPLMGAEVTEDYYTWYYNWEADLTKIAKDYLAGVAAKFEKDKLNVTSRIFHGNSAANIVDYAEAVGHGLICITTHGRTGLGRMVFGSVAERVLQESTSPVLMVRAQDE